MAAITHQEDDVSGVIVGGGFSQAWVTYDGRRQGEICYPRTEAEAHAMCSAVHARIKSECGPVYREIYPLERWKYHFSGN